MQHTPPRPNATTKRSEHSQDGHLFDKYRTSFFKEIAEELLPTDNMVLKLHGSAMATSRVLVTILEKQLPYELIFVDIAKGEQKSDDYKKLQPFGKVPVLEDDGFVMYESRAICKYLAR